MTDPKERKKSILLFASTVNHAKLLSSLIRSSMPDTNCQYIFAGTHTDERCRFLADFRAKKIKVLCNVDILTAGFDAPQVDAVVVGTDRVAGNGDVANKIGTYMVAVLAKRHNIPFYVACPLSTIDRSISSGADIPIEERPISEVTGYQNLHWAAKGVLVRNPAFDVTPAELVTGLITEKGVVLKPNLESINKLFEFN